MSVPKINSSTTASPMTSMNHARVRANEAAGYERRSEVDRELEPAWFAVRRVQHVKGTEVWFLCIGRSNILASYNTTRQVEYAIPAIQVREMSTERRVASQESFNVHWKNAKMVIGR